MKNKYQNFLICSVLLLSACRQVLPSHEYELNKTTPLNQITPKNISFTDEVEIIFFDRYQAEFIYPTEWCQQSDYDENILAANFESDETEHEKHTRDQYIQIYRNKILDEQKYDPLALENFQLKKLNDLLVVDNSALQASNFQLKQQNLAFKKICRSMLVFSGFNVVAAAMYCVFNHFQHND